ncbi:MAG TPA: hypothetical protein VLY46_11940 [Usitatibacter sp.]|nr:hypothetical protein [Usitatibacter sp.]
MRKFIVASLVFEFMALASVAFLIFSAPRTVEPPRHPTALPSVRDDVARARSRLEAAQRQILWNVAALLGISMAAQVACLVVGSRAPRPEARRSGA